jgi:predicted metalloprotease with PDZ domain
MPSRRPSARQSCAVHYQVELADLHAHLFRVTLTVPQPAARQRVALPVWIPGSYLVREFSKNLQGLQAHQGQAALTPQQLDKCSWQIDCQPDQPLVLRYAVYAFDNSVRAAWLDATRGFFNGTSLCLRVEGQEDGAHTLELIADQAPPGWSAATGLMPEKIDRRGFGRYRADSYDELVDCPVELGAFWSGSFSAGGVPHRFVVAGAAPSFDGARLLADAQKICETQIRFWHGADGKRTRKPPYTSYLFMLNATHSGHGGLEHRNSTALICARQDLPRLGTAKADDNYTALLGLISHEYFHTWNVKRLRPAEFARYDYAQENYTQLLWFFEGFTSYYDDLLLRRAGLIDDATYLKLLTKTANQVLQSPGRRVQSVAQASFDAWVKYYRQDENTPNATVSYYTKGALVALCLDLTLRAEGQTTLDDVMRTLWRRCQGGPLREDDLAAVLQELTGRSYARELARWVHGTGELPLKPLLAQHGVAAHEEPAQLAQRLGLRVTENHALQIKTVLHGGAAAQAGFAAGDEWLGVEVGSGAKASQWRLGKLDELLLYAGTAKRVRALVARDQRLLGLTLSLPQGVTTWRLKVADAAAVKRWLAPAS